MQPNDGRVISNFIVQALQGEDITLYGDGQQTRSFCYADELVDAFVLLMDADLNRAVNLGNLTEFTMRELAKLVSELTGTNSKIIMGPLPNPTPT
jgi:UDP-glucuronate decarboxylase